MRLPEFITQLFSRYAPVSRETIATLNVQLTDYMDEKEQSYKFKTEKNMSTKKEIFHLEKELIDSNLDEHTPEYEAKIKEIIDLKTKIEAPTLVEKCVAFFDKPFVKIGLIVLFAVLSRYIAKRLTAKENESEREDENTQSQPYGYPPAPYPYYNPYQGGYNPMNQQPHKQRF